MQQLRAIGVCIALSLLAVIWEALRSKAVGRSSRAVPRPRLQPALTRRHSRSGCRPAKPASPTSTW